MIAVHPNNDPQDPKDWPQGQGLMPLLQETIKPVVFLDLLSLLK